MKERTPGDPNRPKVRIFLKHHGKPEFAPQPATCETDREKGRIGCGASIIFYRTYPNEKRMPFDAAPEVVEDSEATLGDGGVVAYVYSERVHFATCPRYGNNATRQKPRPPAGPDYAQKSANDKD